ncbi:hypothetical protein GCM10009682_20680 [Luedemannella flava]|uniref:Uncharacterized protein n=1 Tax=Luedemannella flava TaxID=349316 RepID=A0ABN2LTB2_9ACTN
MVDGDEDSLAVTLADLGRADEAIAAMPPVDVRPRQPDFTLFLRRGDGVWKVCAPAEDEMPAG